MKKTGGSIVLMVLWASVAAARFEGTYVQGDVTYSWATMTTQDTVVGLNQKFNLNGIGGIATLGYGDNFEGIYLGGEIYGGAGSGNQTQTYSGTSNGITVTNTLKVSRRWNAGVAARLGKSIHDTFLVYFRLGLDYARYAFNANGTQTGVGAFKVNKISRIISVIPGIGVDMELPHSLYATAGVDYAVGTSCSSPHGLNLVFNKNPQVLTLRVGVGYQF